VGGAASETMWHGIRVRIRVSMDAGRSWTLARTVPRGLARQVGRARPSSSRSGRGRRPMRRQDPAGANQALRRPDRLAVSSQATS